MAVDLTAAMQSADPSMGTGGDASHLAIGKGDLTGLDIGNQLPTGEAAKMGQKVHDDFLHGDVKPDEIERDGKINPLKHAWNKFKDAGWKGATTMALFGSIFLGLNALGLSIAGGALGLTSIIDGVETLTFAGKVIGSLMGVIATGITWYGGKAAIQAYKDANQHNEIIKKIENGEAPELEAALAKEQSTGLDTDLPEKGTIAIVAAPVLIADPNMLTSQDMETAVPTERPAFLEKILSDGPKSLSPKELAAQIEAERSNPDLTV